MKKTTAMPAPTVLPYAWVILVVIYLASVAAPFNQFKVPPIMPLVMQQFNISLAQAGSLMSLIALTGLFLALPAGIILQRFGPRITTISAMGFIATGAVLGAWANTTWLLMFSRVVEGMGIGLIGVAAPATIAAWFPPERQGAPMGIWATWVPVGSVVMYNLAPVLGAERGWQAVWWVGAGFALLMLVLSGLLLKSPPSQAGLTQPPLDVKKALSNRSIWWLAASFAFFNLAFVSLGTYYPTFLSEVRGFDLGRAAFTSSIATIVIIFSAPAAGWLSDRLNSRRLLFSLPFIPLAALMVFPFVAQGWQIVAVMLVQGLLVGAIPTATFAAAPEIMRNPQWAGIGLGAILIGQNVGQLIGPVLFGGLVSTVGWVPAGLVLIPVCLLGFLAGWKVKVR
jgi:predicted MFS family arabinose efflux permease